MARMASPGKDACPAMALRWLAPDDTPATILVRAETFTLPGISEARLYPSIISMASYRRPSRYMWISICGRMSDWFGGPPIESTSSRISGVRLPRYSIGRKASLLGSRGEYHV
jgi:hypothetical protein